MIHIDIKVECVKQDPSRLRQGSRHGLQNNLTVKKVAQRRIFLLKTLKKSRFPVEALPKEGHYQHSCAALLFLNMNCCYS